MIGFGSFLVAPLALWIAGLGVATIAQRPRLYIGWTGTALRRTLRWMWSGVEWFARNYRTQIIWFTVGFFLCFYLLRAVIIR